MPPLGGYGFDGRRQRAVLGLELAQPGLVVETVEIEHPDPGAFAGGDADVVVATVPPAADDVFVCGCLFRPALEQRIFGARPKREDAQSLASDLERRLAERGHGTALSGSTAAGKASSTAAMTRLPKASAVARSVKERIGE
jgi:hypothetical protein